ncbi:amidohydrolase [Mangrovimicrobium sediminis]|uniref:Amidohydrolase n=1 Tax=Mangrovimicrobium sediminis TaxID=2562682 RepID=A0A4Z0LX92_9GAMM|nr:amidohydrolase [Haliea sp. SAOS-164]TGD71776.1 amidohydrolase [Haliea sp. SAOS-164]
MRGYRTTRFAPAFIVTFALLLGGCHDTPSDEGKVAQESPAADAATVADDSASRPETNLPRTAKTKPADTIYSGGTILTIDDNAPRAEAVAVRSGRIVAVGDRAEMARFRGADTLDFDLGGMTMLPGFVDSHGHVILGGLQALSANLLSPPDGEVRDIDSLVSTLQTWADGHADIIDKIDLIIGFGYDQSQLAEVRHPTREDLDRVSTDVPVLIIHQSGHLASVNSRGLEKMGLDASSADPAGGVIRRDADGAPNGVLEENAFFGNGPALLGGLGEEGLLAFAKAGSGLWASYGYTTAQEGRAVPGIMNAALAAGEQQLLAIDLVVYPDVLIDREGILKHVSGSYRNRVRIGGAKLTIDGSPQGFTALRDRPYYAPVGDYAPGYHGYAAASMEQVVDAVDWAYVNGVQLLTHANGEGAADMLIAALQAATDKYGMADRRPVIIHGQFTREDHVDAYRRLGVFPSLFPMHTFYWGDWHREHTVGPVNADNISPTGWLMQRGMMFGTHHDAPVALPDSMRVLDATVTRRTRSGDILGPAHRVDVMTALKAMTLWPAWQHFEEHDKGSIEVGKLADFVVLSDDPTAIDPEQLDSLRVKATIKEDTVVYSDFEDADAQGFHSDFPPGTSLATDYPLLESVKHAVGGSPTPDAATDPSTK